jgi:hypothetical protein
MSNKQAQTSKKLVLKRIFVAFEDGSGVELDINKVELVKRATKKPLFEVKQEKKA